MVTRVWRTRLQIGKCTPIFPNPDRESSEPYPTSHMTQSSHQNPSLGRGTGCRFLPWACID